MSLLAFEEVSCVRGGRLLFEGLSLTLEGGDAVQITGANGCGKSSLLRLAAGLLRPTAGKLHRHVGVGLADDFLALDRERTVADALGWWARIDRNTAAIDSFALVPLADVPVRLLSTGQRRRAGLARLSASGARVWLLDEPLNGLDAGSAGLLDAVIADHLAGGGAIIAASHLPLAGTWRRLALA